MIHAATSGVVTKTWHPSRLGARARFLARAPKIGTTDRVTLSGSRVIGYANDGGTAAAMAANLAGSLLLDTSVPQNGYAAIATDSDASNLFVGAGGPTGTGPFQLYGLMSILAQPNGSHNDATVMLAGPPGSDATHKNSGIGAVASPNGPWLYAGGQQNPIAAGSTVFPLASFDGHLSFYESRSVGGVLTFYRDGGKIAFVAGTTELSTGEMGFRGTFPLSVYGTPPSSRNYCNGWLDGVNTLAEQVQLLKWVKREFNFRPKRFFVATGDSITAGHTTSSNTTSYIEQLKVKYAAVGEAIYILNAGISSQTTAQIAARSPSSFADFYSPAAAAFREQWLIINGSKNDNIGVVSPEEAYANLASISIAAQLIGVKTCMTTAFYSTQEVMSQPFYAWIDAFNFLVRENSCGADKVCDFYLDPILAEPEAALWPDFIHPGNIALGAMAARLKTTIG